MKHTTYEFPSGNLPEIEMKFLARKRRLLIRGTVMYVLLATVGVTIIHLFVLPVILN